ncbi:MAG: ethanolamine utilization protein EutN [Kiritimatiellia bacterium]|jgi:ethanolamine utilization protein EutN
MILARIEGSAVCTIQHKSMDGWRLAMCQGINDANETTGEPFLALDGLNAGIHQRVIVTTDGRAIREKVRDAHSPARFMITAILDEAEA